MIFGFNQVRATVLFPTYGNAPFAEWALQSVCSQTVGNIEIFIVCDGSPPEMVSVFNGFAEQDKRIRVFVFEKSERTGEPYRDRLIRSEAKGRNVFYCSHDDLWFPDHIMQLEKKLKKRHFVHSIHAAVNESGAGFDEKNIFKFIIHADLSDSRYRARMLDEARAENLFGLTFAAHRRKSYGDLPTGWTTTPPGIWTDLFMWRKFLAHFGDSCGTCQKITALNFPASIRKHLTADERAEELAFFYEKIQEKDFIGRIRKASEKRRKRGCRGEAVR